MFLVANYAIHFATIEEGQVPMGHEDQPLLSAISSKAAMATFTFTATACLIVSVDPFIQTLVHLHNGDKRHQPQFSLRPGVFHVLVRQVDNNF